MVCNHLLWFMIIVYWIDVGIVISDSELAYKCAVSFLLAVIC